MQQLAHLKRLKSLTSLGLRGTKATDAGVADLLGAGLGLNGVVR